MSLLSMSFSGAVMIAANVIVRALGIHRLPKRVFDVLWNIVLVRLLVPYSLPSAFSVYSLASRLRPTVRAISTQPAVPLLPAASMPGAAVVPSAAPAASANSLDPWTILWLIGAVVCAVFFAAAYGKCLREFRMSLPADSDEARRWLDAHRLHRPIQLRQCDKISAPLTYGVLRPVILMPKAADWKDPQCLSYVLAHEYVHIRRLDAVTKLALTAAVCVHWFNPAVWILYVLANRDLELSCDEAVVRLFGEHAKASYALALIRMEEVKSGLKPLCNSFCKNGMEERIIAIMKWKKTSLAAALAACVLVAGITTGLATSPKGADGKCREGRRRHPERRRGGNHPLLRPPGRKDFGEHGSWRHLERDDG